MTGVSVRDSPQRSADSDPMGAERAEEALYRKVVHDFSVRLSGDRGFFDQMGEGSIMLRDLEDLLHEARRCGAGDDSPVFGVRMPKVVWSDEQRP